MLQYVLSVYIFLFLSLFKVIYNNGRNILIMTSGKYQIIKLRRQIKTQNNGVGTAFVCLRRRLYYVYSTVCLSKGN